jgi:tRNA A-37 threonylcarbamoyl transferase component Bud32
MAIQLEFKKWIKYNLEENIHCVYFERMAVVKDCLISENNKNIDFILKVIEEQTMTEEKAILKCKISGISVPTLYFIDLKNYKIIMKNISELMVSDFLKENYNNTETVTELLFEIGVKLSEMYAMVI